MKRLVRSCFRATIALAAISAGEAWAQEQQQAPSIFRGVHPIVKFDISPPLRDLVPLLPAPKLSKGDYLINDDFWPAHGGPPGPQDVDLSVQDWVGTGGIPGPIASWNGATNLDGVAPPDPNGDVGPNHVVAMNNSHFMVFDKTGTVLIPQTDINTLWSGFGGPCQNENAGDPVVLHDQIADRWMLTQFTAAGPTFYNCVALSQTADPTGSYYRWAFTTGSNFPDYPKYGVWSDAYYISTREFAGASFAGVGAYALNRAQMVAGNPNPVVISFVVPPGGTPYNVGDGLLPADLDGNVLPPAGSPQYFVGAMDDGGPYSAPDDALTVWEFDADFVTVGNSTFTLVDTVPIADYDTMFAPCAGRSCIPQPDTAARIDILSYRQRPLHRLAYRNFGAYETMVTNQSVEAGAGPAGPVAGVRWWELRDPGAATVLFQEGTYAPGITDGVHRWMGSVAMDSAGNIALGYSASSPDGNVPEVYPSVWYTGRLAGDAPGTMPQGEGVIHNGTGSQTGGGSRWGDYTSTTVDPVDDCTFWFVNEHLPVTSSAGWVLRIGAFRFNECGDPDFFLGSPAPQSVCAGTDAIYNIAVGQINEYEEDVTLAATNVPANATTGFVPNPVTDLPGVSVLTVTTTGVAAGTYEIGVNGTATGSPGHSTTVDLTVYTAAPGAPTLLTPADDAIDIGLSPALDWSDATQGQTYTVEIATDSGFTNIVYTQAALAVSSHTVGVALTPLTEYFWRVRSTNLCATGANSTTFSFTTRAIPPTLMVDDDNDAPDLIATYTALLGGADLPFDLMDTGGTDNGEPTTLAALMPYKLVVWFTGDLFGTAGSGPAGPGAAAETALAQWLDLDSGNCLILDSQDYLYDNNVTSFGTNYLGIQSRNDDETHTTVAARNFFGTTSYPMSYPGGFTNYSDVLTATSTALVAYHGTGGTSTGPASIYKDGDGWRTVFLTSSLPAYAEASRQAVFDRMVEYCQAIFQNTFEFHSGGQPLGWDAVVTAP